MPGSIIIPGISLQFHIRYLIMKEKPTYEDLENKVRELSEKLVLSSKIEKDLRIKEKRYRSIFEHTKNGVAVYRAVDNGADFIFIDFNKAGEQIENTSKDKLIGKSVLNMFPGVKEFGLFDIFQKVFKTGQSQHHPISFECNLIQFFSQIAYQSRMSIEFMRLFLS